MGSLLPEVSEPCLERAARSLKSTDLLALSDLSNFDFLISIFPTRSGSGPLRAVSLPQADTSAMMQRSKEADDVRRGRGRGKRREREMDGRTE